MVRTSTRESLFGLAASGPRQAGTVGTPSRSRGCWPTRTDFGASAPLRTIAAALAALWAFRSRGQPTAPLASATFSRVRVSRWLQLCRTLGACPRADRRLKEGTCDARHRRPRHVMAVARYSFLNTSSSDSPEIGGSRQGRYATLHVPADVAHAMNTAPQSPPTVPKPFVEAPSHTHPRLRLHSHAD